MKFKEIFKKIKNKKYCLTALLLAGLLIFAVFGGLNGLKSSKNNAYAATEPAVKNLDLNGVRYTYQTSLNELQKQGFFPNYSGATMLFSIVNTSESLTSVRFLGANWDETTISPLDFAEKSENVFKFYDYNNNLITYNSTPQMGDDYSEPPIVDIDAIDNFNDVKTIEINFSNITRMYSSPDKGPENVMSRYLDIYFYYLPNDFLDFENTSLINEKAKIIGYSFTKSTDFKFNLDKFENYSLRNIIASVGNDGLIDTYTPNNITGMLFRKVGIASSIEGGIFYKSNLCIDNVQFLDNKFSPTIKYDITPNTQEEINNLQYKGNILLSNKNTNDEFMNALITQGGKKELVFNGVARFGGNFEYNTPVNSIFFINSLGSILADIDGDSGLFSNQGEVFRYDTPTINSNITYINQNRLMYLPNLNSLTITMNGAEYSGLSSQVEDILYNVNYVGDIEEIEFNEKVEEDFTNLIKTAGLGGFLGLLLGLLFGVPGLAAGIGALIGLGVGIVPLIIDGLQSIFGKDFLSGLYNFFKSITEFFANFVDTVINFLMSIITNPFVLVFIVIAAIIFLIFYFKNK